MNFELFIAKRLIAGRNHKSSVSGPIIKIAISAIALGIMIMLIAVATSTGLQNKIRDKMAGFKGHIQIVNYDTNSSEVSVSPISKTQKFYPEFSSVEGVKNVQVFAAKGGILRTKTDFEGIIFKGVSTDYDWSFFNEYLIDGKVPDFNQDRNREVLLSQTISNGLKLQVGDTVLSTFVKSEASKLPSNRRYIVSGIYNTGFTEFDKSMMIGDIREVQRLNNWTDDQIGGFEVLLEDFDKLQEKGSQIYQEIGVSLNSRTISESYPGIFEWIQLFDNNVWFIIALMIIVAGVNMISAMLVLILENVQFIGMLKAMGSPNVSIRNIFLYNASYLIVRGLIWGNGIGLAILGIQYFFEVIQLNPETYYVNVMPVYITFIQWFLLNLGTLILCVLMLIIPSYIIATVEPKKAIKFA